MAAPKQLIFQEQQAGLTAEYVLPPGLDLALSSVVAFIDGSGAAGTFRPSLAIRAQSGQLMARVPVDQQFAAGDSGVVTWAPFLRTRRAAAAAGTLLDFAYLSWDYQADGFTEFPADSGTSYGWDALPFDGWTGFTSDPEILLPFVLESPPGVTAAVNLVSQPLVSSPARVLETFGWCVWGDDASPWTAFWEYFSGSPQPQNAPIYRQLDESNPADGLTAIADGESGAIIGGFQQNSGVTAGLISVGIYAVRYADFIQADGVTYPPW